MIVEWLCLDADLGGELAQAHGLVTILEDGVVPIRLIQPSLSAVILVISRSSEIGTLATTYSPRRAIAWGTVVPVDAAPRRRPRMQQRAIAVAR